MLVTFTIAFVLEARIMGRKARHIKYVPNLLVSHVFHQVDGVESLTSSQGSRYPALLMRMSIEEMPACWMDFLAASTLSGDETSRLRQITFGTGRLAVFAAVRASCSTLSREDRAPTMMFEAPALAKEIAVAEVW